MSLGINLLWRARPPLALFQGLSLGPRESRDLPLCTQSRTRRWFSSSTESPPLAGNLEPQVDHEYGIVSEVDKAPQGEAGKSALNKMPRRWRGSGRDIKKMRELNPRFATMIKQPAQYGSRYATRRSLRKHDASVKRQVILERTRHTFKRAENNWFSTVDFMILHTPKFGEELDFKVVVGKAAAAQARLALSDLDSNLWQIQKRHHCKIRIDEGDQNTPLVLILSGTNVSVRASLLDLVRVIGKVSAVRILDPALKVSWEERSDRQLPFRTLRDGEVTVEDETITVYGYGNAHQANADQQANDELIRKSPYPQLKMYQLTKRADEIPRPTVWTKSSFEQYVGKLVLGRVPVHLHQSLYPQGPDHQTTVVTILTQLFTEDELRDSMSIAALRMAFRFINSKGLIFRPAARALLYQAELLCLPLDAGTFHTFLVGASKMGDLQSFNSVLRAMHRKGHYIGAEAWTAFLRMIPSLPIKYYIMRRMKMRGLFRLDYILEEVGRQNVMINLERRLHEGLSIQEVLELQDKRYGRGWLDTVTFNQMLDLLGAQGNLPACYRLMELVMGSRLNPDQYTLNIMMLHTRHVPHKIELLSRLQKVTPDVVTYKQLFQTAWTRRLPNMLRVVWRYAAFANLTSSGMRHALTTLMHSKPPYSKKRAFLNTWKGVILGASDVARLSPDRFGRTGGAQLIKLYNGDLGNPVPLHELGATLLEAYNLDVKIHKLKKEGGEVTPSTLESLMVDIPVGPSPMGVRRFVY